jgi:hypothetical protein
MEVHEVAMGQIRLHLPLLQLAVEVLEVKVHLAQVVPVAAAEAA